MIDAGKKPERQRFTRPQPVVHTLPKAGKTPTFAFIAATN
jgi:hypothetical protein